MVSMVIEASTRKLFTAHSAVIIISGKRGDGKTNYALKLSEEALEEGLISKIATNIISDDERIIRITTFPDLEDYLGIKGRKVFILDEAGKIVSRMRFMSKLNTKIMNVIQLIRHYSGYFIAIAPSEKFIDSNFGNTDILDARIKKTGLKFATVKNYLTQEVYTLEDIEATSIRYSQHPADFSLERKVKIDKLPEQARIAYQYAQSGNFSQVANEQNPPIHKELVKRQVLEYLRSTFKDK